MASFTAGTTFVDGVANDVTAAKLGALVTNATPTSGLIQDRTAETVVATNDTFLIGDASDSNTLKRMTVANVMKAELTGTINTTAGTITTLNSTTGTITGLNSTTGTVATLNSTTGTITTGVIPTLTSITKITSGTGTAAAPAISPTGDTNTGVFFPAADTIAFSEGGAEAMRIDSSGNVGIGTTNPTAKLDVNGNMNLVSTSYLSWGTSSGVNAIQGNSTDNFVRVYTNSAERLRIGSSGDVAVGSSDFANKSGAYGKILSVTGNDCALVLESTFNTGSAWAIQSYSGYLAFINGTGGTNTERLRIDSSGNVGIGDASPAAKLDVNGSFNATSGTIPTLVATTLITTGTGTAAAPAIVPIGDTNTGVFFPAADTIALSEGGTESMRINSSGNVSIGTATALSKLHVHGDLTLSNATTAVTASTSTITPPATVAGYLTVSINGTSRKIAFYAT